MNSIVFFHIFQNFFTKVSLVLLKLFFFKKSTVDFSFKDKTIFICLY